MGVIDDFVSEYERQFDFWEASARTARGLLETKLASSGLRAIVTSRAKSVDRLADKLQERDRKKRYSSVAKIRQDIVDLAGVRVALYFPGQMDEVEQVIRTTFEVQGYRRFPSEEHAGDDGADAPDSDPASAGSSQTAQPTSPQLSRFSGYGARHFRVYIPNSLLAAGQERYSSALVEIQVASVLMHAWSEVQHDLVYKPLEGELSASEYALLDQLNGLVLAGEIALEQLQQAGDTRVTAAATPFRSHYELAEFLRTRLADLGTGLTDATLGRIDVLFAFLAEENAATASSVGAYLALLEQDFETRPVAAQLADLMLSGDQSRYNAYLSAMSAAHHASKRRRTTIASLEALEPEKLALGEFVAAWVMFETLLKEVADSDDKRLPPLPVLFRRLSERELISPEQHMELESMRALRNQVFHGQPGNVSRERLREAAAWLRGLTEAIRRKADGR